MTATLEVSAMPLKISPLPPPASAALADSAGWRTVAHFGEPAAELAAAREAVAVTDLSPLGKIQIEGDTAPALLQAALGGAPERIGQDWQGVYSIRPDLFLLLTPPGGETDLLARLAAARAGQPGLVTLTDLTHGLAALALLGPHSRDLLRRLCALDVSDAAFPNESARVTSVAKTRQTIVRSDIRGTLAFTLVGARSLAEYLWDTLLETGAVPAGSAAVDALALGKTFNE